jgi:hypothetical protein
MMALNVTDLMLKAFGLVASSSGRAPETADATSSVFSRGDLFAATSVLTCNEFQPWWRCPGNLSLRELPS